MSPEEFLPKILTINIWSVVKILVLFALFLYLCFAVLIIKEVALMNRTLKGVFNLPIKIIAWLHFILALLIFCLSWLLL